MINPKDYDNVKVLGTGSFGEALLLVHKRCPAQRIVWKRPKAPGRSGAPPPPECRREIQVMRSLRHENIVRILDSTDSGDIFMEYCDCGDVRRIVKERKKCGTRAPLEEAVIWKWTSQIASALLYCHSQHILHRDMKAENILIHNGDVRVADFGLAKHLRSTTEFTDTLLGTPLYLSPELCHRSPYNSKVDMWGLGMVLHDLMTFESPFRATQFAELTDKILHLQVPDLAQRTPYSKPLTDLCHALLGKNPKMRPSAGDVMCYCAQQHRPCLSYFDPGVLDYCSAPSSRNEREDVAWRKITVTARRSDTVVLQMTHANAVVNVREQPSTAAPLLGQISCGGFVEQVGRININGVTWIESFDGGFCILRIATTGEKLFHPVPDYRVDRPQRPQQHVSTVLQQLHSQGENAHDQREQQDDASSRTADTIASSASSSQAMENARAHVSTVLDRFYSVRRKDPAAASDALLVFLREHLPMERVDEIVRRYSARLRNAHCDMLWTLEVCHELRAESKVFCTPVLRALAVALSTPAAQQKKQPSG